jgi:hypothetical protein
MVGSHVARLHFRNSDCKEKDLLKSKDTSRNFTKCRRGQPNGTMLFLIRKGDHSTPTTPANACKRWRVGAGSAGQQLVVGTPGNNKSWRT